MKIFRFDVKVTAVERGVLNPFTGPQVQALFLNIVAGEDPGLAEELHNSKSIKPYAVRPLRPESGKKNVIQGKWLIEKGKRCVFSLSALTDDLGVVLSKGLMEASTDGVMIGRVRFSIDEVSVVCTSVKELIKNAVRPRRVLLRFLTPTHLRLKGTSAYFPFPLPHVMYANLAKIWNSLYHYKIDMEEFVGWAYENVLPRAFKGVTREVWIKEAKQVGYKGNMEIVVRDPENKYSSWVCVLTKFAEFSNVGAHRTMGMGVVEITKMEKSA